MNEIERIKREKDGLDVYQHLEYHAQTGYSGIPADDRVRLRWCGVYEQKPKAGNFMLRVKIPGG
ncbi:MAG: nitrite/sulfite reductase, partial [Armatimonadota bacterium]